MVFVSMRHNWLRSGVAAVVFASTCAIATPVFAQSQSMVAHYGQGSQKTVDVPTVLSNSERSHYRKLFAAIDAEKWDEVRELLEDHKDAVLYQTALAEFYLHANSPRVSAEQIQDWFRLGVHLPQSEQLGRLGVTRGIDTLPAFPRAQGFSRQPYAPKRILPRRVNDGTMPSEASEAILDRIKNDDPAGAHAVLTEYDAQLSSEARAEWRQRVAWSYYIENDDARALELAETVKEGSGAWVAEGEWVAGLSAWRLGYCALAGEAFARAASQSTNPALTSASHYWAHRSLVRCREPGQAESHLSAAAQYSETLYGMLAADQLGLDVPDAAPPQPFTKDDWRQISDVYNVKVASALVEIGRPALADEVLRHQARVGDPADFDALSRFARELGMPSTQLFMAHNAPYGMRSDGSLRFPVARWQPAGGWRIDPALAFAHALQESNFRAAAVSPANARGLMQIRPGTARDHNRNLQLGASYSDLNDPEINLAYGQQHLEMLRDHPATRGHLPKIMAAYNAGLTPLSRWNTEINDQNDPLLWMESIPYWETRGYVAIVMRNYWMYERAAGLQSPSRRALAQGLWPVFPDFYRTRSAQLER